MNEAIKHLPLKGWETKAFPKKLCTKTIPEEGVKEADCFFACVVLDKRFDNQLRVLILKPYVWKGEGRRPTLFGWVDKDGNIVDHKTNNIHADHETVVAWKRV